MDLGIRHCCEKARSTVNIISMAEGTTIDELPEDMLLHILSFLPTLDAIRSSSVSRKWRNLWHHVPAVCFDMRFDGPQEHSRAESRVFFADLINRTFLYRPPSTPIRRFLLAFDYIHSRRNQFMVDSWVRRATKSGLTVLYLCLDSSIQEYKRPGDVLDDVDIAGVAYEFHLLDLKNCQIEVLGLVGCRFVWPKNISPDLFSRLRSMYLVNVFMEDGWEFTSMVSSCVNLEVLSISRIFSVKSLKIKLEKLRKLVLCGSNTKLLEIHAPKLRQMTLECYSMKHCYLSDVSSILVASVKFSYLSDRRFESWFDVMLSLSGVERLRLENMGFSLEKWVEVIKKKGLPKGPVFRNLKILELITGFTREHLIGIATFLELCPVLENLVLTYPPFSVPRQFSEDFARERLDFRMPKLKEVHIVNYHGTAQELYLVDLLKMHGVILKRIVMFPIHLRGLRPKPIIVYTDLEKNCDLEKNFKTKRSNV